VNLRLKRTPALYLVGFMGSGKSTVGRILADRLGWDFVDLDAEIEQQAGVSIAHLFDARGEAEFRRMEHEKLREHVGQVVRGRPAVIALGGGAFVQPANFELCENNGISIWLDVPLETARRRVANNADRPLARDPQRFADLFTARRDAYARADFRIPIESDDPSRAADAILALSIWNVS
jgi:shikimate kinase